MPLKGKTFHDCSAARCFFVGGIGRSFFSGCARGARWQIGPEWRMSLGATMRAQLFEPSWLVPHPRGTLAGIVPLRGRFST